MCGIVGVIELGGRAASRDDVVRMAKAISHRGPDGIRGDVRESAGLAHARLRVIDLSERADQPLWSDDGRVGVVLNGEIYNFREIRAELEREGVRFRTASDTEAVLRLYERDGENAIAKLDGMFAIAILDTRERKLTLARDRAGKKPLFYFRDAKRFVFGSEPKALHAHPDISRAPDLAGLDHYLTFGYFPAPATGYAGVRALPPASIMTVTFDGITGERRYWSPQFTPNGARSAEAAERVRGLVTRAVEKRLVSDVPVGALLSGGIDSTIVVGVMSQMLAQPVRTFSVGFEGARSYDETAYAEIAARRFRTEHTRLSVDPPDGELVERLVRHYDTPFGDSSAIPTFLVSELARKHVTVVLTGDGGDEVFAGYERFAAAVAAERLPSTVRRWAAAAGSILPESRDRISTLRRLKQFLAGAPEPLERRYRDWMSFFPRASLDAVMLSLAAAHDESDSFAVALGDPRDPPLSRLLRCNFTTYLAEDLLVKTDRATMAHGLEARSPFLDTALVEYAATLPEPLLIRRLKTKIVLREAFSDLLPRAIAKRGKKGFGVPMAAWLRGPLRTYLLDRLDRRSARSREHLRADAVRSLLDAHLAGTHDHGQRLFALLTLEIWLSSF